MMKVLLSSFALTLVLSISACAAHRPRCASRLTPINPMPPPSRGIGAMRAAHAVKAGRP
jgi:hypothetical protein